MSARPVPRDRDPTIVHAVLTAEPLGGTDMVPLPSPELLRHYGSPDDALQRIADRPHQTLVVRRPSVGGAAAAAVEGRVEALLLAEEHDGVVVDLSVPRVVGQPSEEVSLGDASQWYVADYRDLEDGRLGTVGLATFGLPEVIVVGVDLDAHAMYGAVLAGLAHRLIAEWPTNDPVGEATVTLRDIAYGLGDADAPQTPHDRSVHLDVAYDSHEHLLLVTLLDDPAVELFG